MDGRERMVRDQIHARGVRDPRVLDAMTRVPREAFIPGDLIADAFADRPLPIGHGQTISQPYIVAYMSEALQLRPADRVLEIGTGCGYQSAILAELAGEVFSMEVIAEFAERARRTLSGLGYRNVQVLDGDGYQGWPEHAPFDGILVAAAPADIPPGLIEQLAEGRRMVIPVGAGAQELRVLRKRGSGVELLETLPVKFVPMVPGTR